MASDLDSCSSNSNRISTTYDDVLSAEETSHGNITESEDHNNKKDNENQEASEFCGTDDKKVITEQVHFTSRQNTMDQETGKDAQDETLKNGNTLEISKIAKASKQNTSEEPYENGGVKAPFEKSLVKSDKDGDDFHVPRKESDGDKRRLHREGEKELWMLPKGDPCKDGAVCKDSAVNSPRSSQNGDSLKEDSLDSQPVKPPRRYPNKKQDAKDIQSSKGHGTFDQTSLVPNTTQEGDPIKPPRRHLPQIPKATVLAKPPNSKKANLEGQLSASNSNDVLSDTMNDTGVSGTSPKEIICNPVLTSSPNQDQITHLTIESFDAFDTSHRVLSFIDESAGGGVRKVESFYDLLHSPPPSSILKDDDTLGGTVADSDEHLYDSVPLEYGSFSGLDKRGGSETYDEVIVNQEAYIMPPHLEDDSDDQFSETDPWGSDFENDDDLTYDGSFQNQANNLDTEGGLYDSVEISPVTERKRPFKFVSNLASFSPFSATKKTPSLGIPNLKGCLGLSKSSSLPYLASNQKAIEETADVEPDFTDSVKYQQPVMPPMPAGLSNQQIKRHQIVKFMLESEADYMRLLDQLSKQYELPIRNGDLLEPNKIDVIFQHVHRVLQCHVMFNIALSDRMTNWTPDEKIGDVLYALFCTAMVLDAYSGYVNNFTKAMNTVKVACRTHVAFARFLKTRRQASREGYSLHHLMLKPIQRFPQILALLQELLLVTPKGHPDRSPLQLALTQLECLAENLKERKREAELRNKVKMLDALVAQSHKPLASGNRYFVRQDDFVQCVVDGESILGTKKRRIIMLSDMLLCVSLIKGKKDRAMHMITDFKAKYRLKWNVPLNDVDIVEYGPGVDVQTNSYKTTISHSKEGQYRKGYSGCHEHFEDLQQDLAVIGQIAGLVGTLRRSYQVLDNETVQRWHKAVQRTIEEETRLANLYWLELSLPSKQDRVNYIFSTDSPTVKAEWVTAINTCKLRLAPENNPGWYLPEDDGTGGVAIQRRNMPLLKDNTNLFLLNQNSQIQCIVSCPDTSYPLPGIHDNYNNLWLLCSSGVSSGHVSVVSVSLASSPRVIESFHVCESNILCGEYVETTYTVGNKIKGSFTGRLGFPFPTVWLGTQDGRIFIYNAVDSTRRYVMAVKLPDAVLDITAVNEKIFAGIANGSVVVFKRNRDGAWNFSEPKAVGLGKLPVMAITVVGETLWCGCGNKIFIMDHAEELVKHVIEVDENPKTSVKHVISYGVGVWISLWKLPTIKLFHNETLQHVQDISVASPVTNMQRDIDSQLEKTKLDKIYVTALVADEGLLWVGTSVGVTLIFPLPFLEGVPLVSGKACVAFHSYCGRLRCLHPLKNNPSPGTGIHGAEENPEFKLFREHEVRDASVQTDSGISGEWSYAARGPALAEGKKGSPEKTSRKSTTGQENADLGGESPEDSSDEEVHSDDEFSFIEDRGTRTEYSIPTTGSTRPATSSTGSFSVRFKEADDLSKSLPSSVRSDDFFGKTDFHVDDFARMLSEFKGFGSSTPPSSISEPPRIPLVITSAPPSSVNEPTNEIESSNGAHESGEESSGQESTTGSVQGDTTVDHPSLPVQQDSEGNDDEFRSRVKSVGEYVKLYEARAVAEAQGISLEPSVGDECSSVRDKEQKDGLEGALEPEVDRGADGLNVTSVTSRSPSDVETLNTSDPSLALETAKAPEVIYDSPRQDDSYSAFERSGTNQSHVDGTLTVPKVENLKPRLPFPVLLVSAGEGYADLRRKRPDDNDKESRLMIWQIN